MTTSRTGKRHPKRVSTPRRQSSALVPGAAREVQPLIERVVAILEEARSQVVRTVNSTMVLAYWQVGREIVEFVQRGAKRAGYGERVLDALSAHLRERIGRGYSTTNLRYFRTFYLAFQDRAPKIRHIEKWRIGRPGSGRATRHSPQTTWRFWRGLERVEPRRLLARPRVVAL